MTGNTFRSVRDALAELASLIADAQAADPLAPVTILVPSHASGLDVTRYLGRTLNSGAGSAAIRAFTLKDLAAELIATSPAIRGRAPLPPMLRQGAVSRVLANEPGLFKEVAEQPATARAIARTAVLLDAVPSSRDSELPELVREVLRIHKTAEAALGASWYSEHEAYSLAGDRLGDPKVRRRLGTIISFMLDTELCTDAAEFRQRLETAGLDSIGAAGSLDDSTTLITASDADDEARAVVRLVVERLVAGTPGHRIGVFHSVAEPYGALLVQRLTEAGVTFTGPGAHRLIDSPMARSLLRLLDVDTTAPDVRTILNVFAEGTLVWREHQLPSSAVCERLHTKPPADDEAGDGVTTGHGARDRENLTLFRSFIAAICAQIEQVFIAASWNEAAAALTVLVEDFLGARTSSELPEIVEAREALLRIAGELRQLDDIAPGPGPGRYLIRGALEDAITAQGGWTGKSGTGVVIGGYPQAVARDLDAVFFLGAAEGLAPARTRENPLLPDDVRALLGGGLPTVEQRAAASKGQFFAALASGTERTVTSPRGDLRGSGDYQLSRWITTKPDRELQSFAHGIENASPTSAALPPTAQEWRLRVCLTTEGGTAALQDDDVLQRAVAMTRDRRQGVFSRFNGNLSAYAGSIIEEGKALSPTRLEAWVTSPFSYFFKHVLKVDLFEDVELEVQISPLQRGILVHKVLEDFVGESVGQGPAPSSDRLLELAETAFTKFANPAWLRHVWERDQAMIRQDLQRVFDADHARASNGWNYLAQEASFGPEETDSHPPVELELDDGTTVRFRGKVDRIDRHGDGSIKVIDYKNGKADKYKDLKSHPTAMGTRYQLPVYGLFARTLADGPAKQISAQYWFISRAGGFAEIGYSVSDDVIQQLRADAGLIISALRNGVFPPRPESDRYVNVTTMMGTQEVGLHWLKLQNAEELAPYAGLLKAEK